MFYDLYATMFRRNKKVNVLSKTKFAIGYIHILKISDFNQFFNKVMLTRLAISPISNVKKIFSKENITIAKTDMQTIAQAKNLFNSPKNLLPAVGT